MGSRFHALVSIDTVRERFQLQRYLDSMEKMDDEQTPEFDRSTVQAALDKLKNNPEPGAGSMVMDRHIACLQPADRSREHLKKGKFMYAKPEGPRLGRQIELLEDVV